MSGADVVAGVLGSAPELQTAPELALAAANGLDPNGTARLYAHTVNTAAQDRAVAEVAKKVHPDLFHRSLGFLGGAIGNVVSPVAHVAGAVAHDVNDVTGGVAGTLVGGAIHLANVPLQEVQHTYRAIHDVEARHGMAVALLESLGIAAGAVGATLLAAPTAGGSLAAFGGATAAILGGEAAADVGNRLFYKDSWDRTQNGEAYQGIYNRQTGKYSGEPISLGRDVASHLPHSLRFISGITDGLADLALDPTQVVLGGLGDARKAALQVRTVAELDSSLANPLVKGSIIRAFDKMGEMTSAREIAMRFPKFEPISNDLAKLSGGDAVTEYFRGKLAVAEFHSTFGGEIPSLPLTKIPFKKAQEFIQQYSGPGSAQLRVFSLLPSSWDETAQKFSNVSFDPASQEAGQTVYRVMRYTQTHDVAREVADSFVNTNNPFVKRNLWKNGIATMLKGAGIEEGVSTEGDKLLREFTQEFENAMPIMGGPEGVMAASADGKNLSLLSTEHGDRSAAVLESQLGRWSVPNFMEVTKAKRAQGAITNLLGEADDGFYHHFTEPVFKRMALLTGGFALRVAAAETIPAMLREGPISFIRNEITRQVGGASADLSKAEELAVVDAVTRKAGGVKGLLAKSQEQIELYARDALSRSTAVPAGVSADAHGVAGSYFFDTPSGNKVTLLNRLLHHVPEKVYGDSFEILNPLNPDALDHADAWRIAQRELSRSEMGRLAAKTLNDRLAAGASLDEATQSATSAVRDLIDSKPPGWQAMNPRRTMSSIEAPSPAAPKIAGQLGFDLDVTEDVVDPHEDWARIVTEYAKALAGHPTDPNFIHPGMLGRMAKGEVMSTEELEKIPAEARPLVKNRKVKPSLPENPIEKIANLGYQKVIDPIIDSVSRKPMWASELGKAYRPFRALIDEGVVSEAEALRYAQTTAIRNMVPFIHNPLERSQFANLARNFMPFYFAQTQSYRRVGRLLLDDPGAFRQYQLTTAAFHDMGSVVTDDNGNKTLVYPGGGFLAHAVLAPLSMMGVTVSGSLPVAFSGNVTSLATVLPFSEDSGGIGMGPVRARFGPIVSIPMHALESLFPEVGVPLANRVLGPIGASGSVLDQLIPNTPLRNALKAAGVMPGSKELANSVIQITQAAQYRQNIAMDKWVKAGHQPTDEGHPTIVPLPSDLPMVRQQFLQRVKNQARILSFLKAGMSAVVPAAPQITANDIGVTSEIQTLAKTKGPDGEPLGLFGALDAYLAKNPDATPYTVFGSSANTNGAYLPANQPAQDFIDKHLNTLKKYPYGGVWLIPQTSDPYSQPIYQEQLAMGLRSKKAPEQFLKDTYIAQGNAQFYNVDYPAFQKQLAAVQGDSVAEKALRSQFNTYLSSILGAQNPVWWDDFQSKDRQNERTNALTQLQAIFQNGDAPPGAQTQAVKGLLEDYQAYNAQKVVGKQDSWSAAQRDALKGQWQAYVDQLAKDKPELQPLIQKVFRSL